ncbi:MAG: penicillin-binding protein, partial [Candidatus Binataceae bacterium]
PESNLAAGVVGLAGLDGQGLSGVELQYDQMIRGEPVRLDFYQDARGNPILDSPLALRGPAPGGQLELTIDSAIQSLAEAELWQQVQASNAKRGSAIVLDPFSGELLAMANVDTEASTPRDRLRNFAVQDAFEPGSTFKGIVGAIALADGAISLTDQIYCEDGAYTLARRTIHDHSRHGMLGLAGIIQVSSNIGAAKIALRLGAQNLYRGITAFGFGRKTGIDLPGEAPGLVRKAESWRTIEVANHGFGHGIAVTPIQLAVAYAAIANGGLVVRPYSVRTVYDSRGRIVMSHRPQVLGRAISPEVAHTMNTLLRGVVEGPEGTGSRARVDGFVVAGKTGTAQMIDPETGNYYQSRHVSSFVGFVPADDPRLVILVSLFDVGRGRFGGLVAAPVFSRIASGALRELEIYPAEQQYDMASMLSAGPVAAAGAKSPRISALAPTPAVGELPGRVPDFSGLSLRRALELARRVALNIEVEGAGYVVAQDPEAGAPRSHPTVHLALSPNLRAPVRDGGADGVHVASLVETAGAAP